MPNSLIRETSPYLLQHAYNPVNWLPFTKEAFDLAKKENKPMLISIGYSACHWCHVMEHESFEDEHVAQVMNTNFVNVKVDREERSDVDMLYMQAVQLMTGHGGWPLNCFVMPDGRPFYGGTYFNKTQWLNILQNLSSLFQNDPLKVNDYANQLTGGIVQAEALLSANKLGAVLSREQVKKSVVKWKSRLDREFGGPDRAPKFPLPSNYQFLLRYSILEKDDDLLKHVELTLQKMAFGGIYDQLRGGFCRYSTDKMWKVPHFEKMLYDNSQLVSLYCEAYSSTGNELYKEIAINTLTFVEQEWYQPAGNFYSAYDADSDGEEGKYYVWMKADLQDLLGENYELFSNYYEINEQGYWEHDNYILMRSEIGAQLAVETGFSRDQIEEKIKQCKDILLQEAKSRIKPGLDDKSITSWNAMMCSACANAYLSFGMEKYRLMALNSMAFILDGLSTPQGKLYRTYKNGVAKIAGFLDDYAFTIEALLKCYLISQNELYLLKASKMTALTLQLFNNSESEFLYYTDNEADPLVAKTTETGDNVIPASNSQMAINLFELGTYFDKKEWIQRSEAMLALVLEEFQNYGSGYSNWGSLALRLTYPFKEVAIVGKNVDDYFLSLYKQGLTNTIFAVSNVSSDLPLLKNRYVEGKTLYYVCQNKTCNLPVETVEQVIKQLE